MIDPEADIAPDDDGNPRLPLGVAAVLVLVAIAGVIDLVLDAPTTWRSAHVIFEVALMLTSLGFAVYLWRGWVRASRSVDEVRRDLLSRQAALREERDAWRERAQGALANLAQAIDAQFDAWRLTATEREIALLLLKGHGHKQAAAITGRSERTVRQHAVSVYHKAGLSGRAELAAFFLGDLLLPKT